MPSSSSSKEKWNELKKLLKPIIAPPKSEKDHRLEAHRFDQLRKSFASFIANKELTLTNSKNDDDGKKDDVKSKWNEHLKKQYSSYITQLCGSIAQGNRYALRTMCGIIAVSSNPYSHYYTKGMDGELVYRMVRSTCNSASNSEEMIHLLVSEFANPYLDGRYFVLRSVKRCAVALYDDYSMKEEDIAAVADNLTTLLLLVDNIAMDQSQLDSNVSLLVPYHDNHDDDDYGNDNSDESSDDEEEEGDDEESDDDDSSDDDNDDESSQSSVESPPPKKQKLNSNNSNKKQRPIKNRPAHQNIKKLRKLLQQVWLSTLRLPISNKLLKKVLRHLPTNVFTKSIPSPLRFADFYSASFHIGSSSSSSSTENEYKNDTTDVITSLLSLQGLYHLMTQHNLEYPKFYASLYQLTAHSSVFHVKHRIQFCTLLSNCLLKSSMVPAYLIASFCKRLCRLCVCGGVPPSGALFVLALVSNLLRRHGECACLVHRSTSGGKKKKKKNNNEGKMDGMIMDVFDNDTDDPAKSRALESSLWELDALTHHYHPAVSALAKTVGTEDDKTPLYNLEEFLVLTYKSLFDQERKWGNMTNNDGGEHNNNKKRKHRPVALTFHEPKSLFQDDDVFSGWFSVPKATEKSKLS